MKKLLRFIVILLLVLAAGIVVLGLIEPKDVTVERSLTMNAPADAVFAQMVSFKNWERWSPWYKADPTTKMTYSGEDGKVGSSYHWVGDPKKTGEGEMTNTGIEGTTMNYKLNFLKPREGEAHGFLKAEDAGNGMTKASWNFNTHMSFPWNAMQAFMDMDKMLGKDFEAGLKNIKDYVEAHPAATSAYTITEIQFPGHTYAAIRKTVGMNDLSNFFMDGFSTLGKAAGQRITGAGTGIYYTWDETNHNTDVAAGFPVSGNGAVAGATMIKVPASKAFQIVYNGGYSNMMAAHDAMGKYIKEKGAQENLVVEEYIKSSHEEKDSTKWVTNIIYLVK